MLLNNAHTAQLTFREQDVLYQVLRGHSNIEIGKNLGINVRTVEGHMLQIRSKWGVRSNIEVILEAIRKGYLESFLNAHQQIISSHSLPPMLSKSEHRMLQCLCYEMNLGEIAGAMKISYKTLEGIRANTRKKMNASNDAEVLAVAIYFKWVFVPINLSLEVNVFKMKERGLHLSHTF